MRSRRILVALLAVSVLTLGIVACAGASSSAPAKQTEARPAEAAKPAAPAATSAPAAKPAAQPATSASGGAATDAKAAEAARSAGSSGIMNTSSTVQAPAAAAAAPAVQQPGRPAPPAPTAIVPPQPTPAGPANPSAVAQPAAGRMVIFTTEVSMLVANPAQLINSLSDVVTQAGGYVAGVENKDENGVQVTTIRLKLPPGRYDAAMRQIRELAVEVTAEKATTQDVTEEFSDVQTQLASLEATYAKLLDFMNKAQNIDEVLKVQKELSQTKIQIDRLKGRETFLQRSAELATVTVNVRPAADVLARTYGTLRTSLRRAQAQYTQTTTAIQNAKTADEETALRDKLGEINLEIERLTARIADVQNKAKVANISLPQPAQEDASLAPLTDQEMLREYLRLAVELRRTEAARDQIRREAPQKPSEELYLQLQDLTAKISTLATQKRAIENRAQRANVALPSLSADELAALAGVQPDRRVEPGPVALVVLGVLIVLGIGVLFVNRLRRRPPTAPRPTAA